MLNIVLLEPEMPANTGNIGRTCCATGTRLHLIEPMGFKINDKMLKRAGLDYWDKLDVTVYDCYEDFLEQNPDAVKRCIWQPPSQNRIIRMCNMNLMLISCLARRVQGFLRKFLLSRRIRL